MRTETIEMNQILIPIREPELIAVIREAQQGNVSLVELRRRLGRRRADKGLTQARSLMLQVRIALREYLNNPMRCEVDFIKECLGINNGRERREFQIDSTTQVRELPDNTMLLIMKGEAR